LRARINLAAALARANPMLAKQEENIAQQTNTISVEVGT